MRTVAAWILMAGLAFAPPVRCAEEEPLPAHIQVGLLLKALTFDRNLERAGEQLTIGIVYVATEPSSVKAKNSVAETLNEAASKTLKKLRIRSVVIEYTTPADLERAVRDNRIGVIYVTPGSAAHLDSVLKVSEAHRVITITGVPDYVKRGVTLGVGRKQDRNEVLINRRAERAAGSDFDSRLLRLATKL